MLYFAGRTGWLDTYKKIYEMGIGGLVMALQNYPEFLLGMKEATA